MRPTMQVITGPVRQKGDTMSGFYRFIWLAQLSIYVMLFLILPAGEYRIFVMFAYIAVSALLIGYVRRTHS
ncbi:MAG: hypothetical protein ACYCXF_06305 [Thermoleophilia bacterium]